jgi:ABC-type dipeptide/oligopeptide/nickel transport system permease subunit
LKEVHVKIPIPTLKYGSLTLYGLLLGSIPSKVDEIIRTLANNCFNIIPSIHLFIMCVPFSRLGSMGGGRDKLYLLSYYYLMPGLVVLVYNYNKIQSASEKENH